MYYVLTSHFKGESFFSECAYYSVHFRGHDTEFKVPFVEILTISDDEPTRSLKLESNQLPIRIIRIFNRNKGMAYISIPGLRGPYRLNVLETDLREI